VELHRIVPGSKQRAAYAASDAYRHMSIAALHNFTLPSCFLSRHISILHGRRCMVCSETLMRMC